ncbi:ead/Ea22-like family protein [Escherichia coli]
MEHLLMLPVDDDLLTEQELKDYGVDIDALNAFKFLTGPETVLALLDERERNQQYIKRRDQENEDIALTVGKLRVELEEVKQHAEELSETKAVRNQWRPDNCPITGRAFFMWIEHPTLGNVPTYGGPLDSYTIPTKDGDGEFSCERYDHDFGGWVESECLGLYLIDDREQCRVYELEERIAELEAREIKPAKGEVLVVVSGFTGCAKSAIAGEIEIAMKAIGVPVQWTNGDAEKRMTGADWLTAIEMYKPTVRIVEVNVPRVAGVRIKGE